MERDAALVYKSLSVYGYDSPTDYQKTFFSYPLAILTRFGGRFLLRWRDRRKYILQDFEGLISGGEMLLVLGRPGSGCTTLLKTLSGNSSGLYRDPASWLDFRGISLTATKSGSRGECVYIPETDLHFAHLTVAQTLKFASKARKAETSKNSSDSSLTAPGNLNRTIGALNLGYALQTKVGDAFVQGISGGERKRTSIAEVLVSDSLLQCWDNSIRGLDSVNALKFVRSLQSSVREAGSVTIATLYQASEEIYTCFDKVTLLYEGREIYYGPTDAAKAYFIALGFACPQRSTTADFLCSITNPLERIIRGEFEGQIPHTADDFVAKWKSSLPQQKLVAEIESYQQRHPPKPRSLDSASWRLGIFSAFSASSPYRTSFIEDIHLCTVRGFQRLVQDLTPPISAIAGNTIISIILGSMFYNLPEDTSSFFGRGVLLFFTILTNTLLASFEGVLLWDHRPIVEKHYQFAFYRRSAEAVASMLCDLPIKILLTAGFNIPFYFLANMRRTPGAFLTFYLFAFVSLVTGSMLYRTIGAMSQSLTASIAPGSNFILLIVIYTGFVLPIPSMHPWLRWFGYLNPVAYAFESLMINEFDGRQFPCASFVPEGPGYKQALPNQRRCSVTGATRDSNVVSGRLYLETTFQYSPGHLWRNLGVMFGFMALFCCLYLLATESLSARRSRGEVLISKRGQFPKPRLLDDQEAQRSEKMGPNNSKLDISRPTSGCFERKGTQAATFVWDGLSYELKANKKILKLLNDIEGWIEPGTVTALMGESGAGKTTLLNVLANRADTGLITGEMVVEAKFQNEGFARKVGYAQQQDLATSTATVKEALIFSARLRQGPKYSDAEKLAYVEEVIAMLDLTKFADAVIGVQGEGLNIEQRKRVTIGIELAARPELLLFLDEPTSGLDSNTAWSICTLLRKLADSGQAILCTIHQPSGTVFEMFDRLLFIQHGKSVYFGDIGRDSRTVVNYFRRQGIPDCVPEANPAEWLMTITAGYVDANPIQDWPELWAKSPERQHIKGLLHERKKQLKAPVSNSVGGISSSKYASSFLNQIFYVTKRNFEQDWRTPSYLHSKLFLALGAGLVNGFSFYMSANSLQGIQNQIFSVFLLFTLHSSLVQLIMPRFLGNRALFELVELRSRTYQWEVFIVSNMVSEIPSQTVLAIIQYISWYYPLGMYRNALLTHTLNERSGLMFLLMWSYMLFSSTFSQMVATIMPDAATGINISSLLYSLSLIFCGVLVGPHILPRFWIFMYRSTPITYFVSAIVSTGVGKAVVQCSAKETVQFDPPNGQSCGIYLQPYLAASGGTLLNPNAMQQCQICPISSTDDAIARIGIFYQDRWRNLGITISYSIFNFIAALFLYWLFRVPKTFQRAK